MRHLLLVLSIALTLPAIVRSDEATDFRDRALKAFATDSADIKKMQVYTLKAKGISKIVAEPSPATYELSAVWPGNVRFHWEFGAGANKNDLVIAGIDDRGWRKIGNSGVTDLSVEELNDFRADSYAMWVSTLSTLGNADSRLAVAPPSKVGDEPVFGITVSRRSFPDVTLYFGEKCGLLRKMSYRSREAGVTMKKEMVYEGHKKIHGLMLPTKQITFIQGREVFAWSEIEYTFPEKIDSKVFAKP